MYRRRLVFRAALLGLMLVIPAAARAAEEKAGKTDKPTVILRVAALDKLFADFRYLAEVAGQAEKAKQLDGMIKSLIGKKGLEGIDTKKPWGMYGWIGPMGIDSQVVVLIPIADEKAFLDLLDRLELKAEKGQDGVYSTPAPQINRPIYFRFANKYVYATLEDKDAIAKEKLLDPAVVLPAGQVGLASVTLRIDQIPDQLKNIALGFLENQLAGAKDKELPGETEAQKKFRIAVVDDIGAHIKSLFNDGGKTTLRLDVNRETADVTMVGSLESKAGSPLAMSIKDLGQIKSITAALISSDSAMSGMLNVSLPNKLRGLLAPVIEEGEKKALDKQTDKLKRDALASLLKALKPTLKSAELDVAADLRGPGDSGLYTAVFGLKVKNGTTIEKTFRKIVADLPAEQRKAVAFDVEKVDSIAIHRITPDKNDENSKQLFGENPLYFAVRDDAVLAAMGEKGLSALKEALGAEPKPAKVMELQIAVSRLAPLMTKENKAASEIAKKVFAKDKNSDKFRITIEGGKMLKLRLDMKAQLMAFFAKLEEAKNNSR